MKRQLAGLAALTALVSAALACGGDSGQNIPATVNAVSTAAQMTLDARATSGPPLPPTPIPPASHTPPATGVAITDTPAPNPTTTNPPAPTASPIPGSVVRPNGAVYEAHFLAAPPTIDGQANDWAALPYAIDQVVYGPVNWSGASDLGVAFAAGWDNSNLYIIARVNDDVFAQNATGELLYRGDSLELQFDANLPADYAEQRLNSDDYQFGLSPGNLADRAPEVYLWNPAGLNGPAPSVRLGATRDGSQGYALEAAIPWALLNTTPAAEATYGFAFNASDNDNPAQAEQQTMLSTVSTRKLTDPTTWGTVRLKP
jgi:hypothetical protein